MSEDPAHPPPDVEARAARTRRQMFWMVIGVFLLNVLLFLLAAHLEEEGKKAKPGPGVRDAETNVTPRR